MAGYSTGSDVGCTLELALHRLEDGRFFIEDGRLWLNGPRLALEAGRRVDLGGRQLRLAASGGASLNTARSSTIAPWVGASFGYSSGRLGLGLEYGWHRVEIERTIEGETAPFARVRTAEPALLLMVTYRVW